MIRKAGGQPVAEDEDARAEMKATVVELLPRAMCRVKLEDGCVAVAHAAGAGQIDFVRLRAGDRVRIRLSPHDPTRGRILGLLEQT